MSKRFSLLAIGNPYDGHFVRFIKYIKQGNPDILIDVFGLEQDNKVVSNDCVENVRNLFLFNSNRLFSKIPGLRTLELDWKIKEYFHRNVARFHYDIVNIHYPSYYHKFILSDIKIISKKMVLTPWGSDVYRISDFERKIVRKLYDAADVVTGNGLRFTKDFMRIYEIPESKFRHVHMFGDQIDYYFDNKDNITVEEAKRRFNIDGYYVITCGYNGSEGQRHMDIIDAINRVKCRIPENIALLFPFTYAGSQEYRNMIKRKVEELGFKAAYCEQYLDLEGLLSLRKATDMFIHIQPTDANNSTLKEYLLLGKNVINGGWLRYDDVETEDYKPYHTTPTVAELDETILRAYKEGPVPLSQKVLDKIESYGHRHLVPKWIEMFESIID